MRSFLPTTRSFANSARWRALALALAGSATLGLTGLAPTALACSRITWSGPDQQVITGRSMDWPYGFNSLRFTSRYGAVVVSGSTEPGGAVDGVFDGMNEKGVAANLLYLAENDFGIANADTRRPRLSFASWTLYLLSQYATVEELVTAVRQDRLQIVPIPFGPGGKAKATVHMAVSDASGDSAVIEYLKGKPVIHHGRQYQVMTNSPVFSEQLKLNAYWQTRNRNQELPGSIQSPDRFVRGSYFVQQLPPTSDPHLGALGHARSGAPQHLAHLVWVNLRQIDFRPGSGIRAIPIEGNPDLQGNLTARLRPAASIQFLAPKP